MPDLNSEYQKLQQAADVAARSSAEIQAQVKEVPAQIEANTQKMVQAAEAGAGLPTIPGTDNVATILNVAANQVQLAKEESRKHEAIIAQGANLDDPDAPINQLLRENPVAKQKMVEATKKMADDDAVKLLDNPVKFAFNQIIGRQLNAEEVQSAKAHADAVSQGITLMRANVQDVALISHELKKNVSEAVVDENLRVARATVDRNIAETENKGIMQKLQTFAQLQNLNSDQLRDRATVMGAAAQLEHVQMARQELAMKTKEFSWKESDMADKTLIANMVTSEAKNLGLNLPQLPSGAILKLLDSKDPTYMALLHSASAKKMTGTAFSLGASIAETADTLISLPQLKIAGSQDILDLFGAARQKVETEMQKPSADKMLSPANPKELPFMVGKEVSRNIDDFRRNLDPNNKNNPFMYKGDLSALEAVTPGVSQSNFYQKVIVPNKITSLDADQIIAAARAATKAGTVSMEEAVAGIQTMVGGAIASNNASKNFAGFGIKEQGTYPVPLKGQGFFGGKGKPRDLYNPLDIRKAIMDAPAPASFRSGVIGNIAGS